MGVHDLHAMRLRVMAAAQRAKRIGKPAAVHTRRRHIHETTSRGERIADAVTTTVGSWLFIIGQTAFIIGWIVWNSASGHAFDPFPWILLNLCMSTQAMFTGPFVMLSQNRQAAKDRARDDTEAREVDMLVTQSDKMRALLDLNTKLTEQVAALTREVHAHITAPSDPTPPAVPFVPAMIANDPGVTQPVSVKAPRKRTSKKVASA